MGEEEWKGGQGRWTFRRKKGRKGKGRRTEWRSVARMEGRRMTCGGGSDRRGVFRKSRATFRYLADGF